jgi:hypothetical protein
MDNDRTNELISLSDEVARLKSVIKQEADYCYFWSDHATAMQDHARAKRHKERGDRLMSSV